MNNLIQDQEGLGLLEKKTVFANGSQKKVFGSYVDIFTSQNFTTLNMKKPL